MHQLPNPANRDIHPDAPAYNTRARIAVAPSQPAPPNSQAEPDTTVNIDGLSCDTEFENENMYIYTYNTK